MTIFKGTVCLHSHIIRSNFFQLFPDRLIHSLIDVMSQSLHLYVKEQVIGPLRLCLNEPWHPALTACPCTAVSKIRAANWCRWNCEEPGTSGL